MTKFLTDRTINNLELVAYGVYFWALMEGHWVAAILAIFIGLPLAWIIENLLKRNNDA